MNFLNEYGIALGWTLIHMTWIILGAALVVQLIRLVMRSPRFNYLLGMSAMLALPAVALTIFMNQIGHAQSESALGMNGAVELAYIFVGGSSEVGFSLITWLEQHMDWIIVIWFAGMISFIIRILFGYTSLVGFRNSIQPMSDFWTARFEAILSEFDLRKQVLFGGSKAADGPMTFGFMKPVILLPIGLVNALSVDEVEAIIRHELAHIARHDYLFKMIQSAIESLFYYTPGTWWLTKMIDIDREQCCDDYAIRTGSNADDYVKALYKVNTFNTLENQLALGFGKEKNQLLNRVKRILKQPQEKANIMGRLIIPIVLLLIVAGVSINATYRTTADAAEIAASELMSELIQTTPTAPQINIPSQDTSRNRSKSEVVTTENGQRKSHSVTREDGRIVELIVDGQVVDPSDYHKYEDRLQGKVSTGENRISLHMPEEDRAMLREKMQRFEGQMENLEEVLGEDFEEKMEDFGRVMEEWAEDFENSEELKDFTEGIEAWGAEFGESFGEEMAEWGENFGKQFAEGFSFKFDESRLENWGKALEEKVEEYRKAHPENFRLDEDGTYHFNSEDFDDEDLEELFGKDWMNGLTGELGEMFESFDFDFPMPPAPPAPPAPPSFGNMPAPPAPPVPPAPPAYEKEVTALKEALQADGFMKKSGKVSFQMDAETLTINGEKQGAQVYKKYKKIVEKNWGKDHLDNYEMDFKIIDKKNKKKTMIGTYKI